jgi:hypothetical protein
MTMTTIIENLRTWKLQLERQLKQSTSAEQREWIEGELTKIDIALSFLDDLGKLPSRHPVTK